MATGRKRSRKRAHPARVTRKTATKTSTQRKRTTRVGRLTAERFTSVLAEISAGNTVSQACVNVGVGRSDFYHYLDDKDQSDEERSDRAGRFARSKQEGADARFDNIVTLTEEMIAAVYRLGSDDRRAGALVNAYNNKIHAEKWVLKILNPARYNDAIRVEGELTHSLSLTELARRARS